MKERLILITKQLQLFMKLNTYCNDHGWMVYNTTDPEETLTFIKHRHVAGIIWDLATASPDTTLSLIKKIRVAFNRPILTLANTKDTVNEMQLFALHVDDYIIAPYEYEEIIVRMQQCLWSRAIQTATCPPELINQDTTFVENLDPSAPLNKKKKNPPHPSADHLQPNESITLDVDHCRVLKNNEDLRLTPKEFKLLYFLIKNKGHVISREQLLRGVWNYNDDLATSRIVDIHISHLRDKIEPDPHRPEYVKTVRGFGYIFESKNLTIVNNH